MRHFPATHKAHTQTQPEKVKKEVVLFIKGILMPHYDRYGRDCPPLFSPILPNGFRLFYSTIRRRPER